MKANFSHVTKNEINIYKHLFKILHLSLGVIGFPIQKCIDHGWIAVREKCPDNGKYDPEKLCIQKVFTQYSGHLDHS